MILLSLLGVSLVADAVSDDDDQETNDASNAETTTQDGEPSFPSADDIQAQLVITDFVASGPAVGSEGFDDIAGGDGTNTLFGRGGTDFLSGGTGADSIFGGEGEDFLFGQSDDDLIRGGNGDDYLNGGLGNDTLIGDAGNDRLEGIDVEDIDTFLSALNTGEQDPVSTLDFKMENAEADTLSGGAGDDVLFVGGNDEATTGVGNDVISGGFWIEAGEQAIVTDFEQGEDLLVYNYDTATGEPELSFDENEEGDAQFLINDEVVMVLEGVDFMTLSNSDVQLFEVDLTQL